MLFNIMKFYQFKDLKININNNLVIEDVNTQEEEVKSAPYELNDLKDQL